jgi:hypothetical protein
MKPLFRSCGGHLIHDHFSNGNADEIPTGEGEFTIVEGVKSEKFRETKREWHIPYSHLLVKFLRTTKYS